MAKKILFYYCFALALFITISGVLSSENTYQLLMQFIFLPVTIYFSYSVFVQIIDKNSFSLKEVKINKMVAIITLIFFSLLFALSIRKIIKKPAQIKSKTNKVIVSPDINNKIIKEEYVVIKNEYLKDKINVREIPSTTGKILGMLENKPYPYIGKKNNWYEIVFNENKNGFVNNQFVELKK